MSVETDKAYMELKRALKRGDREEAARILAKDGGPARRDMVSFDI